MNVKIEDAIGNFGKCHRRLHRTNVWFPNMASAKQNKWGVFASCETVITTRFIFYFQSLWSLIDLSNTEKKAKFIFSRSTTAINGGVIDYYKHIHCFYSLFDFVLRLILPFSFSLSVSLTLLHFTLCVYFDNMLSSFMEVIFFNEQSSINDWIKLNKSNRLCLFFAYSKITSHVIQRDEPLINWIVKLVFIYTRQWLEFSQFCFAIEKVNTIKNRHKQQLHFTEIWIRYT